MSTKFTVLKERVERLRTLHLKAMSSFHAYEEIQEYRSTGRHGNELARLHAQAVGVYKGFFNVAEKALNTELHISVAKLFDSHKDALHIQKLVNYAEQNQAALTAAQTAELDEDDELSSELSIVYQGLSREDLLEIKTDLNNANDKIERLKDVRDKQVAHEDITHSVDLKYLTYEEFTELIALSDKILNLVSKRLYGDIAIFDNYRDQVIEDTRSLLRLVGTSEGIIE